MFRRIKIHFFKLDYFLDEAGNNMLGFNGREARLAGRVREMEEQNQLLRRQLSISQNHLVAAIKNNHSNTVHSNSSPCNKNEVLRCTYINKFIHTCFLSVLRMCVIG